MGSNNINKLDLKEINKNFFTSYIPEINALRGIAILAVLINHLNKEFLPGGFFGVDLFFVLSGYVVSIALAKAEIRNFNQYIINFYSNRLKRILPALFFCILITAIFSILFIPPSWLSWPIPKTGIFGIFGLANIALMQDGNGYFSPRSDMNPFTQLWSLGVEEQFYFIFPIVFYFWLRLKKSENKSLIFYNLSNYFLIIASIFSLIYSINTKGSLDDRDYYSIFSRFWEIGSGAILFQIHSSLRLSLFDLSRKFQKIFKTNLLFFYASLLIYLFAFLFLDIKTAPIPGSIPIVIATIILIDCFKSKKQKDPLLIKNRFLLLPLDFLGKISYSTYLYHWPVIVLIKWTIGLSSLINYILAITLSLVLGYLSYKYIESPLRKLPSSKIKNKVLIFVISILSAVGLTSSLQFGYANQKSYSLTKAANTKNWVAWDPTIIGEAELPIFDFKGKSLFVIGDSHAGAYGGMNLFLKNNSNLNYRLYQIAPCNIGAIRIPVDENYCKSELDNIFKEIKSNSKKGDIVFIANLRLPRYRDQWEIKAKSKEDLLSIIDSKYSIDQRKKGEEQLDSYIKEFSNMGLKILLDLTKPVYPSPPFRCVDWFNKNNIICKEGFSIKRETHEKMAEEINKIIYKLSSKYENVYTWDPNKVLCEKDICNAYKDGEYLYFDGDHISAVGNKLLYKDYVNKLKDIYENN